ncbi:MULTISPECIES: hypothetical protein [Pantoea]|uniref:hypothetical protein n=2 Tax=Pantoea TaxID=53335 RepID=UPI001C9C0A42|nr:MULTISPECIES: hypothetical protein [Pantoea]
MFTGRELTDLPQRLHNLSDLQRPVSAAGNIIKVPMDKILNTVSKQYEWVPSGVWTITKSVSQHPLPSVAGNIGDSIASGLVPSYLEKKEDAGK